MLRLMGELQGRSEELHIVQNHLLIKRERGFELLDTGVPRSQPAPRMVSAQLGVRVNRLIGTEELAEHPFRVDWLRSRITFGARPRRDAIRVPLDMSPLGVPTLDFVHGEEPLQAVFDTGAPLSYAPKETVTNMEAERTTDDFLPLFGTFSTPVYRVSITVGGIATTVECGVLPDLLQMALGVMLPHGWILGTALLKERVTVIDLGGRVLHVEA